MGSHHSLGATPGVLIIGLITGALLPACSPSELSAREVSESAQAPTNTLVVVDRPISEELGVDPQQALINLGRRLMFDVDLSRPRGVSCGMCHDPQLGWGDARPQGKGVQDNTLDSGVNYHSPDAAVAGNRFKTILTPRNTPTIYNAHIFSNLFWDGRAGDLRHQAQFPFEAGPEMNSNWVDHIIPTIEADPTYVQMFVDAFGDSTVTRARGSEAIGAYEETISVFDSPYDLGALDTLEAQGYAVFTASGCTTCHVEPFLSDDSFHNTGVPTAGVNALTGATDLGFGVRTDLTVEPNVAIDEPADYAKFKTPQLRMLAVTGPYMHNGAFATLEEVVEFYDQGGGPDLSGTGTKDVNIQPLGLAPAEKAALVAFLRTGLMGTEIK